MGFCFSYRTDINTIYPIAIISNITNNLEKTKQKFATRFLFFIPIKADTPSKRIHKVVSPQIINIYHSVT